MTTELTMTPFRATALLRRFKHDEKMLGPNEQAAIDFAISAITALTQRPAAQEVDGPISASLGDIVALWDQHAPSEYMTAIHMQAKRALAGQQPMSPDMARWCAYVGGMVAHWVKSEPDALARLGDDAFEAAIAGIIERRLWAMPKPAPQQATPAEKFKTINCQVNGIDYTGEVRRVDENTVDIGRVVAFADEQATPEPVGEPLSDVVEKKLRTLMGAVNSYEKATGIGGAYAETVQEVCNSLLREVGSKVKFGAGHENPVMPTTLPAPGVPEDVQRDAERYRFIRDANRSDCITREISLYAMESLDEYVDAAMEGETAALAAAQAKGGQA